MRSPLSAFAVVMVLLLTAGCARPPELVGVDNPEIPSRLVADASRHTIFITSTRAASAAMGAFYSGARAPDLGLASVDVSVPGTHEVGKIERPRSLPPNPRTEFAVVDPVLYRTDAAFISEIDRALALRPLGDRKLLLFVHGYNTNTSDAVLRLAQFVEDTGYQGVPVLFTWASAASAPRYVYDLNSALVARVKVAQMASLLAQTNAESLDIFAHSMGTFLTMEGLVDAQSRPSTAPSKTIDHIVLASPDIDIDLFRTQIAQLPKSLIRKMYILVSSDDSALQLSRRIAGGVPRVGAADTAELEQFGATVIDLSNVGDSISGSHLKFAGSPEVVKLIGAGLRSTDGFGGDGSLSFDDLLANVPIRVFPN